MSAPLQPPSGGDEQESRKRKTRSAASTAAAAADEDDDSKAKQPKRSGIDSAASNSASASTPQLIRPPPPSERIRSLRSYARVPQMLPCLSICRDVQFALMQMLGLKDFAHLDATCRTWRAWLLNPPLLAGLNYRIEGTLSYWFDSLLRSRWLPQLITSAAQFTYRYTLQQRCETLRLLSRCTRLREVRLWMPEVPQAELTACFASIAGTLRILFFEANRCAGAEGKLLTYVFRALHALPLLESLEVVGHAITPALDFSALPLMPHLSSVTLRHSEGSDCVFYCSAAQVRCLARCRSLTSLDCGSWSPDERTHDDEGMPLPSAEQQIAEGIGALVSGFVDAPAAAASASASATSASAPAFPAASLTHLNLDTSYMTPAVWKHVSRLTSLTGLRSRCWSLDISATEWAPLAHFIQLREIDLDTGPIDGWLQSEHIVSPLLNCVHLQQMLLCRMRLSREQLHAICTGLPLLIKVGLIFVQLGDCAPLSLAPSLCTLTLMNCSGLDGAPVQFRSTLPAMTHLTRLMIDDPEGQQLTTEQAAPLNAALFARMPKLTPQNFEQNLLSGDEDEEDSDEDSHDSSGDELG